MNERSSSSPPKVPLVFRIGVVGHRPNRLGEANLAQLDTVLHCILETVRTSVRQFAESHPGLYAPEVPRLVAVSSCAEGSDRIFAAQAISLGYSLHCPMPFPQDEYEKDFRPPKALEHESLTTFRTLLEKAKADPNFRVFELDGKTTEKEAAYGQAGSVVLNQSDILVAVWDGADAAGTGGTVDTLEEAISYRVPVICVDARQPHDWELLREKSYLDQLRECRPVQSTRDSLLALVNEMLDVPGGSSVSQHDGQQEKAKDYFTEHMPKCSVAMLWKFFRNAVGENCLKRPSFRLDPVEASIPPAWSPAESGVRGWVNGALVSHFVWADRLADYYADCYRSSYLFAFLGSALAVFLAILPLWVGWDLQQDRAWVLLSAVAELGVLLGISGLIWWGNQQRWHERWMEYRVLSELIRELHFLIPLGGWRPIARPFSHLGGYGRTMETWMSWHARAVERVTGLPSVRVDKAYVLTMIEHLKEVVQGQVRFHRKGYLRHQRIEHRLHQWGLWLFGLTAFAVAIHLGELWVGHGGTRGGMGLMTVTVVLFPVAGSALMGIKYQGAFARLAMRNEAMAEGLTQYGEMIDGLMRRKVPPPTSAEAVELTMSVAQLMLDEVVDWRVIALVRPLVPPS